MTFVVIKFFILEFSVKFPQGEMVLRTELLETSTMEPLVKAFVSGDIQPLIADGKY